MKSTQVKVNASNSVPQNLWQKGTPLTHLGEKKMTETLPYHCYSHEKLDEYFLHNNPSFKRAVLLILEEGDTVTQASRKTSIPPFTIQRILDTLEHDGIIRRGY